MKKIGYLILILPILLAGCSNNDDIIIKNVPLDDALKELNINFIDNNDGIGYYDTISEKDGRPRYDALYKNMTGEKIFVKKIEVIFYDKNDNPIFISPIYQNILFNANEIKSIGFFADDIKDAVKSEMRVIYSDDT